MAGPLLTLKVHDALRAALRAASARIDVSLDLDRSVTTVEVRPDGWTSQGETYPWLDACKERTVYYWTGAAFEPAQRYAGSLIKLVPTEWGPPTFEIDGIKMLVSEKLSPWADAEHKVALVQPRGKVILDTCAGLGYFAAWCLQGQVARVLSFEKNPDVLWLRSLNPWSPPDDPRLTVTLADISRQVFSLPDQSVDAVLHDPPRFGIAGELYSQAFYDQLARVIRRKGRLFHYTGAPNKVSRGRDLPEEVSKRLAKAGFDTRHSGDGVLAVKK